MNYLGNNIFARSVLSLLIVGIMSFGVLGIVSMNHEMGMTTNNNSISQNAGCAGAHDVQDCFGYHIGIMRNLSVAAQNSPELRLASLFLLSFIGLLALLLFRILDYDYTKRRISLRQLYEKTITAFTKQLGYWLTLFGKRDPAYAFVLA